MANHKSAVKRAKQNRVRRLRNKVYKTRMKNAIKNVTEAVADQAPEEAAKQLAGAVSVIQKNASTGVIHKNKAARKISRLARDVNGLTLGSS